MYISVTEICFSKIFAFDSYGILFEMMKNLRMKDKKITQVKFEIQRPRQISIVEESHKTNDGFNSS
jgi:hypothetical protein